MIEVFWHTKNTVLPSQQWIFWVVLGVDIDVLYKDSHFWEVEVETDTSIMLCT